MKQYSPVVRLVIFYILSLSFEQVSYLSLLNKTSNSLNLLRNFHTLFVYLRDSYTFYLSVYLLSCSYNSHPSLSFLTTLIHMSTSVILTILVYLPTPVLFTILIYLSTSVILRVLIYSKFYLYLNYTCGEEHCSSLLCSKGVLLQNKVLCKGPIGERASII